MPVEVPLRGWRSLRLLRYGVLAAIGGVCFCQLPGLRRSPHPLRAVAEVETQEVDAQLRNLRDLASQGLANEAEDALYEMIDAGVKPESLHFSAIIASCAPNADVDRAERWLFRMKALEVEPTMEVFQELMHVAAEAGNPTAAEQWMNEAWQEGHEPSLQSFKYLLRSLRKSGDSVRVETWFERLMQMQLQPDMDCVNEIIGAYVDQENLEKAIEWKAIAKRLGLIPNVDTYKLLIATYAKMGLLQEAEDLFDEMQKDRQEVPEAEFYALLTGDGRSFRPRETVQEWSQRLLDAKIDIDSETYTAVIGACASVGDAAQAEDWFARMMEEEKATPEALAFLVDALTLSDNLRPVPRVDSGSTEDGTGLAEVDAVDAAALLSLEEDCLRADSAELLSFDAEPLERRSALKLKEEGNSLVRCKKFQEAIQCYEAAIVALDIEGGTEQALLSALHANLALCHLQLESYRPAHDAATRSLELDPKNMKALYRRCLAHKGLEMWDEAQEDLAELILQDAALTRLDMERLKMPQVPG